MLGGGVLIVLATFLNWAPSTSGLNTDLNGLFGILILLIGLGFIAVGAIRAFSPSTSLPEEIAGFSLDQLGFAEALTVFLWSFALVAEDGVKFGAHLAWIGGAVALAGVILALRSPSGSGATTSI
jgi:hypothetical protein